VTTGYSSVDFGIYAIDRWPGNVILGVVPEPPALPCWHWASSAC
jgi:hypothetical protein